MVGFPTNAARAGTVLIEVETAFNSDCTVVNAAGDLERAALYADKAYLFAMDEAERESGRAMCADDLTDASILSTNNNASEQEHKRKKELKRG
jgi:hypothetical protein